MFDQLIDYIKSGDLKNFTNNLGEQELTILIQTDEKHGGTLSHWAAYYDRVDILKAIRKFQMTKNKKNPKKEDLR